MARTKSNGTNSSTATIGFGSKLWLTAEQAVPALHFGKAESHSRDCNEIQLTLAA